MTENHVKAEKQFDFDKAGRLANEARVPLQALYECAISPHGEILTLESYSYSPDEIESIRQNASFRTGVGMYHALANEKDWSTQAVAKVLFMHSLPALQALATASDTPPEFILKSIEMLGKFSGINLDEPDAVPQQIGGGGSWGGMFGLLIADAPKNTKAMLDVGATPNAESS